jgi:hypothetical protein
MNVSATALPLVVAPPMEGKCGAESGRGLNDAPATQTTLSHCSSQQTEKNSGIELVVPSQIPSLVSPSEATSDGGFQNGPDQNVTAECRPFWFRGLLLHSTEPCLVTPCR